MDINEIISKCDHTLLKPECTWDQIKELCDDCVRYGCATVCIPPCYVREARELIGERAGVCTVVGFPNGSSTTETKCFETHQAVEAGASEIDMVMNIGWMKSGRDEDVLREINAVKAACGGRLLKVIAETCLLSEDEKIRACRTISESDADYIKTSTGFSSGGATFEDVSLFSRYISNGLKIKAAGGISSLEDAEMFIKLGASRLGTSRIVNIVKQNERGYK